MTPCLNISMRSSGLMLYESDKIEFVASSKVFVILFASSCWLWLLMMMLFYFSAPWGDEGSRTWVTRFSIDCRFISLDGDFLLLTGDANVSWSSWLMLNGS